MRKIRTCKFVANLSCVHPIQFFSYYRHLYMNIKFIDYIWYRITYRTELFYFTANIAKLFIIYLIIRWESLDPPESTADSETMSPESKITEIGKSNSLMQMKKFDLENGIENTNQSKIYLLFLFFFFPCQENQCSFVNISVITICI